MQNTNIWELRRADDRNRTPYALLNSSALVRAGLPDMVYAVLKHRILTCSLKPSKKLNEKVLADELNVSRTPLREALNRLALEGLVYLIPYKGYMVSSITVEDLRDLCELRRIVESEAAALAATRATPADCNRLKSLAELRYTPGDPETYDGYQQSNAAFHTGIAQCTGNPRLERVVGSLIDQFQRPLYLGLNAGIDARASTEEHIQVLAAIRAGKPGRARKLMAAQLLVSEKLMLAGLADFESSTRKTGPVSPKKRVKKRK